MRDLDKFLEKNSDGIFKMKTLLKDYPIRYIVISTELQYYLDGKYLWNFFKRVDKDVSLAVNYMFPSGEMNLISMDDQVYTIKFDVFFMYSDEDHK